MNASSPPNSEPNPHDPAATRPVRLSLVGQTGLEIEWSDGRRRMYDVAEIRSSCPCAGCLHRERSAVAGPPAGPDPAAAVSIRNMTPVGNYAYKIVFSDGHDTGIYPLSLLRNLGHEEP